MAKLQTKFDRHIYKRKTRSQRLKTRSRGYILNLLITVNNSETVKAASFKSYVGPEPVPPVPTSAVQSQLQAWTLRETQTRWQDLCELYII